MQQNKMQCYEKNIKISRNIRCSYTENDSQMSLN